MAREHTGAWSASGQANLKIELYFCRLGLKYMRSLSEQAGLEINRICTDFMEKWKGEISLEIILMRKLL